LDEEAMKFARLSRQAKDKKDKKEFALVADQLDAATAKIRTSACGC
jgi:hypothetical protein